jgi:hypothetical protein
MKYNPAEIIALFKKRISLLLSKNFFRVIFFLPIILFFLTLLVITLHFSDLPPEIPLYYSKPWGEDQLTHPIVLFLLPVGSLVWFLITIALIALETYKYRVFAQLLLIFSSIVAILSSCAVFMILMLVL